MRYRLGPWTPEGDSTQIGLPVVVRNAQPTTRGSYREIPSFLSLPNEISTSGSALSAHYVAEQGREFIIVQSGVVLSVFEYRELFDTYTNVTGPITLDMAKNPSFVAVHPLGGPDQVVCGGSPFGVGAVRIQLSNAVNVAFANLSADAPFLGIVVRSNDFLLAFGGSIWHCCAIGNIFSWTPSSATQATTGTIDITTGDITAAVSLVNDVVVFKQNAIYLGRNIGPPQVWSWQLITNKVGTGFSNETISVGAILEVNGVLYFFSDAKLYSFDGVSVREISAFNAIRFYAFSTGLIASMIGYSLHYSQINDCIWIHRNSGFPNTAVFFIFSLKTGVFSFGRVADLPFGSGPLAAVPFMYTRQNFDRIQQIGLIVRHLTSAIKVYKEGLISGSEGQAEFQFGPYGQEDAISHIERLRLVMYRITGTVQVLVDGSDKFHGPFVNYYNKTVDSATQLLKFDTIVAGSAKRWHKITIRFNGEFDFDGFDLKQKILSAE